MCMKKEGNEIPVKKCGGSCSTTGEVKIPSMDPEKQHEQCHGHADAETTQATDTIEMSNVQL